MSLSVLYDAPGPKTRRRSMIASIVGVILIVAFFFWMYLTLAAPRVNANGAVQPGTFDPSRWDILALPDVWISFGVATLNTLRMAAVAAVLAVLIGILFSFGRTSVCQEIATL